MNEDYCLARATCGPPAGPNIAKTVNFRRHGRLDIDGPHAII
jgi:hypothetical protein